MHLIQINIVASYLKCMILFVIIIQKGGCIILLYEFGWHLNFSVYVHRMICKKSLYIAFLMAFDDG